LRRKESFKQLKKIEREDMDEKIFYEILSCLDGDYVFKAQILASMKPTGW